jgi:hypothetical protein
MEQRIIRIKSCEECPNRMIGRLRVYCYKGGLTISDVKKIHENCSLERL